VICLGTAFNIIVFVNVVLMGFGRDEYCPNCDNHFVIDAITPKAALKVESDDTRMDARMLKDERVKQDEVKSIWEVGGRKETEGRLG
jgi:hypothetical protein